MARRPPGAKHIHAPNDSEVGGAKSTTNIPNILLNKTFILNCIFQVSQGLLKWAPIQNLLKPREMMFIGSVWSAKLAVYQGMPHTDPRVSQHTGHWERGRVSFPTLDSGLKPRM